MRSQRSATRRSSLSFMADGALRRIRPIGKTTTTMLVSSVVLWLTRRSRTIHALVLPSKISPLASRNRYVVVSSYHHHHHLNNHDHRLGVSRPFSSRPIVAFKNDDDNEVITAQKDAAVAERMVTDILLLQQQQQQQPQQHQLFRVTAQYAPTGDQPQAIAQLVHQLQTDNNKFSILQGITGTGKTLVMSHIIAALQRPTLVLCHNKTLAAQLARELRSFLSDNAVELFVSYYNHYIPESYSATTGKYIAKKSSVNAEIDALRHRATRALLMRRDVVVVASVSCIYGLGLPSEYLDNSLALQVGITTLPSFQHWLEQLDRMLYTQSYSDDDFERGQYQILVVEDQQPPSQQCRTIVLWPPHERFPILIRLAPASSTDDCRKDDDDNNDDDIPYTVTSIQLGRQNGLHPVPSTHIFPAKHHVLSQDKLEAACEAIEAELRERVKELMAQGKGLEAERLQQRTVQDVMMIRETGFCKGAENYSRHFAGRPAGAPPNTLLDYLGGGGSGSNDDETDNRRDWLLLIDESHVALPQLKAMHAGDQARKRRLVQHGYRLPSALDNRPLSAHEFWDRVPQALFVSATPGKAEQALAERVPVEMVIRPTFVPDPVLHVRPSEGQLEDLRTEIEARVTKGQRSLAMTLTKRDAEDLASYLTAKGINATYIHSGLTTHERSDALKALQSGEVDCLVGVNLLREGLDLPQVSLVAILSADCEGFLRSETSLLQTVGRAARNVDGTAIFYAKRITSSMQRCIDATQRRREKQLEYIRENQCEMRSTEGSSMMSIFDLSKDEIDAELALELLVDGDEKLHRSSAAREALANPTFESSLKLRVDKTSSASVDVDHVPSSPGCYFWRDGDGAILYIGKAAKLRSRVKSYLSGSRTKHSSRIQRMLQKARSVDFLLTPSERDALVLESNLIKHHQPPYNVLLKDDEHYPYICASSGDSFPRLFVAPNNNKESSSTSKHRYFGPYTSFKEINAILEGVEEKYGLRQLSFQARHGEAGQEDYRRLFETVLDEVFGEIGEQSLQLMETRKEYEEAGLLFESDYNQCRDVVVAGKASEETRTVIVHVSQLREGLVAGQYSYACELPSGAGEEDIADAIHMVLEKRHYPAGANSASRFSWFPDDILLSHESTDIHSLEAILKVYSKTVRKQKRKITIGTAAQFGPRQEVDARLLRFASQNAEQAAIERSMGSVKCLMDGSSAAELATIIGSEKAPSRIECYDVSHSQGDKAVASRVVFVNGRPVPLLYRKFNIKTVQGVDDYASLEEVLERRFRRLESSSSHNGGDCPWVLPDLVVIDGGPGQLNAAIKGMAKAGVAAANCVQPAEDSDFVGARVNMASVAVCSLAKREEKVFVPGSSTPVNETPDSPAVLLLRALRDESHRFALISHVSRRRLTLNNR